MMKKSTKFIAVSTWIISTRIYDAYCTYQLTPNLEKESNPLVSILGMSWTPLIAIIGILTNYTVFCYFLVIFKPMKLIPTNKGYSFKNFVAFLYLGKSDNWPAILYKLPKDFQRFNQYFGILMSQFLVFAGIVSTSMWFLINYTNWYKNVHSAAVIYTILIVGCVFIAYFWNKKMYQYYIKD